MSDTVIVGGGLAGGFAAALLARSGVAPLVLERSREPADKVCGEFLSAEAQGYLRGVGLDLRALGAAPITHVRIASGTRLAESALPFPALGLTRRRLDEALLRRAEQLGAQVSRGVSVRRVNQTDLETSAGDISAKRVLLASGKHDIRGAARESASADWGMVGFKLHLRLAATQQQALGGAVEIVLFEGGYAGLQLVEGRLANLCLLVREASFAEVGRSWPALLERLMAEPHLRQRLSGAEPCTPRPLAIARLPFGFLRPAAPAPGVYPIGDQAAVIASFTGDGMSIALHSARLAAAAVEAGVPSQRYLARLRADVGRPVGLAGWLQRRTEAWPGRAVTVAALAAVPAALSHLARLTRVPPAALARSL